MMACVADKIVASPFALLGSIGVYGTLFNAHSSLKRLGVETVVLRAGKHKNVMDPFSEITEQGVAFQQQWVSAFNPHCVPCSCVI